jgi:cytochrome c peroxidase
MNRTTDHRSSTALRIATIAAGVAFPLVCVGAATPDVDVDQKAQRFTKSSVTLTVGSIMHFHNSDDVIHNIMLVDSNDVPEDQGMQKPGEVISTKFERPDTYQVRCSIHPKMKMTIQVVE